VRQPEDVLRQVSTSFAEGEFTKGRELPGKWQVPQAMIGRRLSQSGRWLSSTAGAAQ
jgi:hypothetical protein